MTLLGITHTAWRAPLVRLSRTIILPDYPPSQAPGPAGLRTLDLQAVGGHPPKRFRTGCRPSLFLSESAGKVGACPDERSSYPTADSACLMSSRTFTTTSTRYVPN